MSSANNTVPYSQALQSFINDDNDVVGLIAYALYKQNIQQRSLENLPVPPPGQRTLVSRELNIYRDSAKSIIGAITTKAIEDAVPDILLANVVSEVRSRTRFSSSLLAGFLSGLASWFFSLIIIIVIAISAPEWAKHIAKSILQG